MTILELINKTALMLNISPILDDKNIVDVTESNEAEIVSKNLTLKKLHEFAKVMLNEVESYLPKVAKLKAKTTDKKISLIGKDIINIISVKNDFGYVKYEKVGSNLIFDTDGEYTIIYNQKLKTDSVLDIIENHNGQIGDDLLVNGLSSYYCLSMGMFAEFNVYHAHYVERLSQLKSLKVFSMPCRSWHD